MAYANGNYTAFYVKEPFDQKNNPHTTKDFNYYHLLQLLESEDDDFHFIDSHDKNYDVRDDSDWEKTLKPRLHDRLKKSKNIIFILSSITKNSRALKEEIDYGINTQELPIIVAYPDYKKATDLLDKDGNLKKEVKDLWDKLPTFRDSMDKVPTLHVPFKKAYLKKALDDNDFKKNSKKKPGRYRYTKDFT